MNFALSFAKRFDGTYVYEMDLWINEGLSEASEWIWSGRHSQQRINHYNNDPFGTIRRGNNFFVWDNYYSIHPGTVLDDYATVNIFFHWLRLQAGGPEIYRTIANSSFINYRAVTTAAHAFIPNRNYNDWETLLRTWLAANYINAPSGPFGYRNDPALSNIRPNYLYGSGSSFPLFPGEGVYSKKTTMPGQTQFIRYAGLPARGSSNAPNTETNASGFSALLSFNIDTRENGPSSPSNPFSAETILSQAAAARLSALSSNQDLLPGPYSIGLRDMLRRNEQEENLFDFDISNLSWRNEANE
jgi:hypothetical protein